MFGLLPQLLIQLLLLKGAHGCCKGGIKNYQWASATCKEKPTTKPVEQTTQGAPTRPHRPNIKWQEWGPWSHCTKSCGRGVQWRRRTCKDSTRYVLYRADYEHGGDDGDVDNNTEDYNDGKANDARKCKVGKRQTGLCATRPCTGRSLNSNDGAFVMMSCSDSVESSAEEGIL